jgi:hypothetical protein
MMVATCSPSRRRRVLSESQCTPSMRRPGATLVASFFSSPPTVISVASPPVYGGKRSSMRLGVPGFQISSGTVFGKYGNVSYGAGAYVNTSLCFCVSSNHAFNTVTHAPLRFSLLRGCPGGFGPSRIRV